MREKLYEGIYLKLANDIRTGFLKAGTRLPSIRRQAEENGVSRNTVIGAYSLLIAEGYIISKEKSGYFAAEFETPS
ncbi:MAG: GntR family transcriptional regulator [Spirochaetales bacterium]